MPRVSFGSRTAECVDSVLPARVALRRAQLYLDSSMRTPTCSWERCPGRAAGFFRG